MTRDSCLGIKNIDLLVGVPNSLPLKGKTDFSFGISSLHFVFYRNFDRIQTNLSRYFFIFHLAWTEYLASKLTAPEVLD